MRIRASIESLSQEDVFFNVNSAIVRSGQRAPVLTADMLQPWSRVQAKISTVSTHKLDILQQLDFLLVEGEADFMLPVMCAYDDPDAQVVQTTDIPALRQLAGQASTQSCLRIPWYAVDASTCLYAQQVGSMVLGTFDHQCLVFRTSAGDIRGYVSLRELNATDVRAGLLTGHGVGVELIQATSCWAQVRGKTTLRVTTRMGNTAMFRRYTYSGANVENAVYRLHKWRGDSI